MRIALTGNPNSGKATMYNALTGRSEKVGNWAGVTVEKKEHPIKKAYAPGGEELIAVDLPGAYSMSPFTSEESITSAYVRHEKPDAIINIVDATNLSRSLFFTTQLLELGVPVVVALNKSDASEKQGTAIDAAALSAALGCPVVKTVSTSGEGLGEAVAAAAALRGRGQKAPYVQSGVDLTDKKAVEEADRRRFTFVGTLAVCFVGLQNFIDTDELAMIEGSGAQVAGILAITRVAALAYLMFNLYTPPCFAAIGAMNSEMKSAKWLWAGIGLQLGTGYSVGVLVYQFGTLFTTGSFGAGALPGLAAVAVFGAVLAWLCLRADRSLEKTYSLKGVSAA